MKKFVMLFMVGLLTSSCATLFTGSKDSITFNSEPSGATVYLNGIELCKTPCRVPVKRELGDTDVEISLDGYQTRMITLDKEFNVVSILNLGNLLGWGIDAVTGSVMKYDRKQYNIELKEDKSVSSYFESSHEVRVDTKNETIEIYVIQ